jgi:DNA-binding NarL/FixJ family response regulator
MADDLKQTSIADHGKRPISVLIVDDVAAVRWELRTALSLVGNIEIVGEASDGQEAVVLAQSLAPAVVLMDLAMPGMDGYQATREIKIRSPGCRVIALTVHGYESARRKAVQSGVDDFVVKGAPLEKLLRVIAHQGA